MAGKDFAPVKQFLTQETNSESEKIVREIPACFVAAIPLGELVRLNVILGGLGLNEQFFPFVVARTDVLMHPLAPVVIVFKLAIEDLQMIRVGIRDFPSVMALIRLLCVRRCVRIPRGLCGMGTKWLHARRRLRAG